MEKIEDKIYKNSGNRLVVDTIYKLLKKEGRFKILDLGCGAGDNAKLFKDSRCQFDGITISPEESKYASEYFENIYVYNLEFGLPSIIKENSYDLVICSHVLEHICYPCNLLEDIKNVLTDNGNLLVIVPNIMHYSSRVKLMIGNFNYTQCGLMDYTHFRWYTFYSLHNLLLKYDYEIIEKKSNIPLPVGRISYKFPSILQNIIKTTLYYISPGFFSDQISYLVKK